MSGEDAERRPMVGNAHHGFEFPLDLDDSLPTAVWIRNIDALDKNKPASTNEE